MCCINGLIFTKVITIYLTHSNCTGVVCFLLCPSRCLVNLPGAIPPSPISMLVPPVDSSAFIFSHFIYVFSWGISISLSPHLPLLPRETCTSVTPSTHPPSRTYHSFTPQVFAMPSTKMGIDQARNLKTFIEVQDENNMTRPVLWKCQS